MQEIVIGVFSVSLACLGLSYIVQAKAWASLYVEFEVHPQRFIPTAFLLIVVGLLIATIVNDWTSTWPIFITAFGWLMAIEGALIAFKPALLTTFTRVLGPSLVRFIRIGGLLVFGLGLLLVWEYFLNEIF